jgi:signal recognition particle subunit SRP54
MNTGDFTLEDFRRQMRQIRKLGTLRESMKMIPGQPRMPEPIAGLNPDADIRAIEAIIDSMTPLERAECDLIDDRRCRRIARGSGSQPEDVLKLLSDFRAVRQLMRKLAEMSPGERMGYARRLVDPDRPGGFRSLELN